MRMATKLERFWIGLADSGIQNGSFVMKWSGLGRRLGGDWVWSFEDLVGSRICYGGAGMRVFRHGVRD